MPRKRLPVPSYRLHKQSGQAVMTVPMPGGRRRDIVLGRYGSPESKAEYRRQCSILDLTDGIRTDDPKGLTVNEVVLAFLKHAERHYRRADGSLTYEYNSFKQSLKPLRILYGDSPAAEFGPLALQAVRRLMIQEKLSRKVINQRVNRIRRMFKWAESQELVPAALFYSLATVTGLQRGRTEAHETDPVKPVDESTFIATMPFLTRHVAGLLRFMWYTGCRPGEACAMRWADIDRSGPVWFYRPERHKAAHHGKDRCIAIGVNAQAVLMEFTGDGSGPDHVFSPAKSVDEVRALRSANRQTPRWPSHMRRNATKRTANPERTPSAAYDTAAIAQAVANAAKRANTRRAKLAGEGNYDPVPHWHPNQIRHAHGTAVRMRFGLEAAQVALGHARADVTQVYAERNMALAAEVAKVMG